MIEWSVTDHAADRYAERIKGMTREVAREAIREGLARYRGRPKRLDSGCWGIRLRKPHDCRLVVQVAPPKVITVVPSGGR